MDSDSTVQDSPPNRSSSRITLHVRPSPKKPSATAEGPSEATNGVRRDSAASSEPGPSGVPLNEAQVRTSLESNNTEESTDDGIKTPPSTASNSGRAPSPVIEPGSSPSVPIEIAEPEDIDSAPTIQTIIIEGDDNNLVQQFIFEFPYRQQNQHPKQAAKAIIRHLENEGELDKDLLTNLLNWFKDLDDYFSSPGQRIYWDDLFYTYHTVWEQVALIFQRLAHREYVYPPFSVHQT
jgi:hypothetical protein